MMFLLKKLVVALSMLIVCNDIHAMKPGGDKNISYHKDIWRVTLSKTDITLEFSSIQLSNIIMNCLNSDAQIMVQDGNFAPLIAVIEKNNIRPDSVPNSITLTSDGSSSSSASSASLAEHQTVINRVRSNLGILNLGRTLKETRKITAMDLCRFQARGNKSALKKAIKQCQDELEKGTSRDGKRELNSLITLAQGMLESQTTQMLHAIRTGDLDNAQALCETLNNQWPWFLDGNIPSNYQQLQSYVNTMGFNELAEARALLYARPDYQQRQIVESLKSHQDRLERPPLATPQELVAMHQSGDKESLQKQCDTLIQEIASRTSAKQQEALRTQLEFLQKRLNDPMTRSLCTIKTADLATAKAEYAKLVEEAAKNQGRTMAHGGRLKVGHPTDYLHNYGFDHLQAAGTILKSRPDYQAELTTVPPTTTDSPTTTAATVPGATTTTSTTQSYANSDLPTCANTSSVSSYTVNSSTAQSSSAQSNQEDGWRPLPVSMIPKECRSVRAGMLDALNQSTGQVQLADTIDGVRREIFDLARHHNYEIYPEVEDQVHVSIGVIRGTRHEHEIVFHVAIVDRVLGDVQTQVTGQQISDQPSLLERSPELLVHGLKKFIQELNPVTQVQGMCELLVDTACFTCDMTVGKLYLSPQEYQARKDGFWETMNALSPENLAKLSAEHWVELAANMAAGVVVGGGIYKTVHYLRQIEATSRVGRQAAKIAGALKGAVDTILVEHPILVTAEGVLINNYDKIEKVTEKMARVIRNADSLIASGLPGSSELSAQVIARTDKILALIKEPLENLIRIGNKIKTIGNDVFDVSHTFSPRHVDSGILSMGKTAEEITLECIALIQKADLANLLTEGTSNIQVYINGAPLEVRPHIQNGFC